MAYTKIRAKNITILSIYNWFIIGFDYCLCEMEHNGQSILLIENICLKLKQHCALVEDDTTKEDKDDVRSDSKSQK